MASVKVYSTASCPWCHKLKDFLKKNNVKFQSVDVGMDEKAAEEMIDKSGQMGVPVVIIDDEVIVGYDEEAIKKKLNLK
jgi:glutaredoxin-like YruB-family protein